MDSFSAATSLRSTCFLVRLVLPACLQLHFLAGEDLRHLRVLGVGAKRLRQREILLGVDLRFEPRLHGQQAVFAEHEAAQLRLRRRVVEAHQRLPGLDQIAFAHEHVADDAAFEMLHLLVLAGGDERARGDDGTVERRQRRPQAEAADPRRDDGETCQRRPADAVGTCRCQVSSGVDVAVMPALRCSPCSRAALAAARLCPGRRGAARCSGARTPPRARCAAPARDRRRRAAPAAA